MVSVQKISKRSARKGRSRYVVVAAIAGALITAAGMYVFFDIQQRQAAAAYAIDEFLSSSYTGPIDDERLQTYAQDVARRKDSSEAVRAVGNLNSAIERRRSTLDSKATASLGQAAITVMRSTSQPNWDRIARIVRDAMLMRNRNDDTVMLAYLRKLADDEDQSGRGMEREALAIKHMAGQQLLNTGHAAEGMAMMKDVINADPDKQPYYYSVGQFLLVAKAGADKQPEAAITRTTSFINTYGKRDPYKQFLPCFYSLLGQQFNDLKQTRDMWWSGYASGVDYLDHPQLLHENDDVDAILLNTAAYDGVAAVSATIELAHDGRDSKKHAEQMLSDIESRPFCQSSDKCKVEFSQLRERLQALRVRGRGTNG